MIPSSGVPANVVNVADKAIRQSSFFIKIYFQLKFRAKVVNSDYTISPGMQNIPGLFTNLKQSILNHNQNNIYI
jgi:hypothetical protein